MTDTPFYVEDILLAQMDLAPENVAAHVENIMGRLRDPNRVVVVSHHTEAEALASQETTIRQKYGFTEEPFVYCVNTTGLTYALTGAINPANRETWVPPKAVFYTGRLRYFDPEEPRYHPNINDPDWIREAINHYGINDPIKLEI